MLEWCGIIDANLSLSLRQEKSCDLCFVTCFITCLSPWTLEYDEKFKHLEMLWECFQKKHLKCWIFKLFETWYGQLNSFSLRKIITSISNTLFEHFQLAENIPFRPSQPCLYVVLSVENIRAWDVFNKMPEPKLEPKSTKSVLAFATDFLQYNRKK